MVQELQNACRSLLRTPGFSFVSVLLLALGIAGSTAIYALLDRVVLDPLPYPDAERLVRLKSQVPGVAPDTEWDLSAGEFFHFRSQAKTLTTLGAYRRVSATVQTPAGPRKLRVAVVSAGMMPLIGATPASGRLIAPADDDPGARPIVVLSHQLWQRDFAAAPGAIGQPLVLFNQPVEVVGVMAPHVELPHEPGMPAALQTDAWLPLRLNPNGPFYNEHTISMIASLRPGASIDRARAELDTLTAQLPTVVPTAYSAAFFQRFRFRTAVYPLKEHIVGAVARNLWLLFGAVTLVLVTAAANVANLFLVRLEGRRRDLAIRMSLGATRASVARQFLAEHLLLALVASLAALLLGGWGIRLLIALAPPTVPRLADVGVDGGVVVFTLTTGLVAAAVLTLFPMLRLDRGISVARMAEGGPAATVGRDRQRVRSALIVTQVTLALTLSVGAVLLAESVRRLRGVDPGIQPEGVLTLELAPPPARYQGHERLWALYKDVVARIRALPDVAAAGFSTTLPFTGGYGCTAQGFEDPDVRARLDASEQTTCGSQTLASPAFFETMGIPIVRGRGFIDRDNDQPASGSVVVSQAFANRFWPGEDPIGKGVGPNGHSRPPFYRVVGVVGDVYGDSVDAEKANVIYYPVTRIPNTPGWSAPYVVTLVVRTRAADPTSVVPAIRRAVTGVDAFVPIANIELMPEIVDRSMSRVSFVMVLMGVAAAVALLLSAIGLYVVMSYIVARRTHEIGLRLALGAQPADVRRQVIGRSARLLVLGLVLGTVLSAMLARGLGGLLFGVAPTSPVAYAAAMAILTAVAFIAAWIPARRAARLNPLIALRTNT
jgi:putative ABC transport system permease protein